jgi:hypothetical protein
LIARWSLLEKDTGAIGLIEAIASAKIEMPNLSEIATVSRKFPLKLRKKFEGSGLGVTRALRTFDVNIQNIMIGNHIETSIALFIGPCFVPHVLELLSSYQVLEKL